MHESLQHMLSGENNFQRMNLDSEIGRLDALINFESALEEADHVCLPQFSREWTACFMVDLMPIFI